MKYDVRKNVENYGKKHRRKKLWLRAVSVLGCVVVFCTTYALILPAITMENETYCGVNEHIHEESCYKQITEAIVLECQAEPHEHIETCCDEELNIICGYADFFVHAHDEKCFDENGETVCLLEEIGEHEHTVECLPEDIEETEEEIIEAHIHGDDCYEELPELTCTLTETEGHAHEDICYPAVQTLICELEAVEGHAHTEACYTAVSMNVCGLEESEEHTHIAECSEETSEITCGIEAVEGHAHGTECYAEAHDLTAEAVCGIEEGGAHFHGMECSTVSKVLICEEEEAAINNNEGNGAENLLVCEIPEAEGHIHSEECWNQTKELACTEEVGEGHVHGAECYTTEVNYEDLVCTLEVVEPHAHDNNCSTVSYILVCVETEAEAHAHTDECLDEAGETVCGKDETEGHTHSDADCYTASEEFYCTLEETEGHAHTDECYGTTDVLTCEEPETEGHVHTDDCYEITEDFICTLVESEGHIHGDECYEVIEAPEEHVHDESCYTEAENLVCELPETEGHAHDELCYENQLTCVLTEEGHAHADICYSSVISYACGFEESEFHTHADACMAETVELTCELAESEPHTHDEFCWGDVLVCEVEEIEAHAHNELCYEYEDVLSCEFAEEIAEPVITDEDAVCGMKQAKLHKHNDALCYDEFGTRICGRIEVLEHKHNYECFVSVPVEEAPLTCELEENDEHAHTFLCYGEWELVCEAAEHIHAEECFVDPNLYTFSDENVYVEVKLPDDTAVPNDAQLVVTPITDGEEYENYLAQAEEAVDGTVGNIALYDISFNTADGEYLPVSDTAQVSMAFVESPVVTESVVEILHFEEDDAAPVSLEDIRLGEREVEMIIKTVREIAEEVIDAVEEEEAKSLLSAVADAVDSIIAEIIPSEPETETVTEVVTEERTVVEFETNGFSTFAVVQVETGAYVGTIHVPKEGGATIDGHKSVTEIVNDTETKDDDQKYIIVTADNKYALSGYAYLDNEGEDKLKGMEVLKTDGDNIYVNANEHLLWTFEGTGETGRVYIRNVATGEYLQLVRNNIAITTELLPEDDFENHQMIYALKDNAADSNIVAFCAVNMEYNEEGELVENIDNNFYYLNRDGGGNLFHTWKSNFGDKNNHFLLYEYKYTETDVEYESQAPEDSSTLATDLGGQVYFVIGVNNGGNNGNPPWLATTSGNNTDILTGENRDVTIAANGTMTFAPGADSNNNLGWYFQQTEQPGVYYLRAANDGSTNEGRYLKISAGNNNEGTLTMVENMNDASRIEAVKADTSTIAADAKQRVIENVICLRTTINGEYWYVNLDGNNNNNNFQSYHNTDEAVADSGNHFVLAEIEAVNNVVTKINTLLDNMIEQADGSWIFSDAAYTGSAAPYNENNGQQGVYSDNYQQPFMDDYDQAQAYRREMQLLAREIRKLYAELPEEDQRYVWRYEIVDVSGTEGYTEATKDLKWLWDVVEVVQPNNPTGVKVNLFNYDGSVNDTGLAYRDGGNDDNDPEGLTFYHMIQYDEYTMVDRGRDETRHGGTLGTDNSALTMSPTLGEDGYPVVTGGARKDNEYKPEENNNGSGSLAYLFRPTDPSYTNDYHIASMTNGGGLFQRDADGYYYYYANQNAAWYDPDKNQFVLYDTVIRPMYNHGYQPNAINDVYNFLPFNNPYDDLIFDEPNTIMSNQAGKNYDDRKDKKGNAYVGVAANKANTERSGYLNERSDMWFGMTIEFDFLMSDDGQLSYYDENGNLIKTTDMIFDFYGDDDVWVYVDDKLVLDIGGVHEAQGGSINFHTGEVTYQDSQAEGGVVTTTLGEIFANEDGSNNPILNGDTFADYTPHTLKFFYMERGGNVSYCGLKFNMPILPVNYLMVNKELAEKEDDTLTDADILGDKYYTFRVIQADDDGNPLKDTNGKYMSFFDEYTPFNIYSGGNPTGNFGLVDENGYFTIRAGDQAMFENVLQHRADNNVSNYIVMEVFFNEDNGQYEDIIYTIETEGVANGGATVDPNPNFDKDAIDSIHGEAVIGSITQTTGVDAAKSQTVKFTNVLKSPLGRLAVTKKLASGVEQSDDNLNKEFTIKIELGDYAIVESATSTAAARAAVREVVYSPINKGTEYELTDKSGNKIKDTVVDFEGDAGEDDYVWEVSSTDGTIKLKPGQTAVFEGLVSGTFYRISEQLTTEDKWTPTYSGTIVDLADTTANQAVINFTGGNANGQFGYADSVNVTITNQNYSTSVEIPLRKFVEYAAMTDTFTFKVENITGAKTKEEAIAAAQGYYEVPGTSITVTPKDAAAGVVGNVVLGFSDSALENMTEGKGVAYYRISEAKGNGSYIYDTTYYIVEVSLMWDSTTEKGTAKIAHIWKNGTEEVEIPTDATPPELAFTNHRTTSVTIDKEVVGGSTADEFEYSYTVKYPDENTTYKTGSFKLNHGEKYEITGVPIGAIVEVTETARDDYAEFYEVTAYYEAEYGDVNGAGVVYEGNPSAGAYVGNIKGSTQTVTIPVYTNAATTASYFFRYGQHSNRSFAVTDDGETKTYGFNSTGGWQNWTTNTTELVGHALEVGPNNLVIGGNATSDAPNLDYLKIDFGRVEGNTAAVNVLGDGDTIHFVNEPRTTVTVHKTINGDDKTKEFVFNYTVTKPDGTVTEGSLSLADNEYETITDLPLGSIVEITEEKGTALTTTMQVSTRLEAEDGVPTGAVSINTADNASSGKWAGNIHANRTLTFNDIKMYGENDKDGNPVYPLLDVNLFYMQDDTRSFNVSINGTVTKVTGNDCDTWSDWNAGQTATIDDVQFAETNTIIISGTTGDAPNLDYIDLVWPQVQGASVTVTVNGATTIEVVNETGYTLPETGSTGTLLYTYGGLSLMIGGGALLMYRTKKRRKEGRGV